MNPIDYVRWMGIAAWTCGAEIPRRSVVVAPGPVPGRIVIQSTGGNAQVLTGIEREHMHIQWLLGGAPRDEGALDYVYHQQLNITTPEDCDGTFAVVDVARVGAQDYSPEASLELARRYGSTEAGARLAEHIPSWNRAEPLGLLALAVREYFTEAVVRERTREFVRAAGVLGCGRLAYSVTSSSSPMTLHALAGDPLFSRDVVEHLIERAQVFANTFGSEVDCHGAFPELSLHTEFPATVHEPDAEGIAISLYRIPLSADMLPAPWVGEEHNVILHRDPHSDSVQARAFVPGESIVDQRIHVGGYLDSAAVVAEMQQDSMAADPHGLGAHATKEVLWESLATWGQAAAGAVHAVRANNVTRVGDSIDQPLMAIEVSPQAPAGAVAHDVCDVLDALGVGASVDFPVQVVSEPILRPEGLPVLWPRALGARQLAATDRALALAAVRAAVREARCSWVGVRHELDVDGEHRIMVAVAGESSGELERLVHASVASSFPGAQVTCEVIDASALNDAAAWITAAGYHPVSGYLPAFMQLERYAMPGAPYGCASATM